ncbi:Helix-turn-helix domain-containing protein [Desulfonatronum zhilinae]|nr:Helix-turn-helix domain-containing protein [Desulfonatronum zhilinae]
MEYVNDVAAAARLGLSVKTLRAWRLQGRGPRYLKLGRAVRYLVQELDAWASRRTVIPIQEREGGRHAAS